MNISIRDVQMNALDTLLYVDGICKKHGLTYFLSGGTLLGAVRHKGFIPWDDDVDIMMPRPDYLRLNEILTREKSDKYDCGSVETDPEWSYPWARVWNKQTRVFWDAKRLRIRDMGIFVDIFPIDGLPNTALCAKAYFGYMYFLNSLRNAALRNSFQADEQFRLLKRLIEPIARRKGEHAFVNHMNRVAARRPIQKDGYAGVCMTVHYGSRERMASSVFERAVEVDFEGYRLPAPIGWDTYLSRLYGDYMLIPPEDKRVSDHIFYIEMPDDPETGDDTRVFK